MAINYVTATTVAVTFACQVQRSDSVARPGEVDATALHQIEVLVDSKER